MNKKSSNFEGKYGLNYKLKYRKAQTSILSRRFGDLYGSVISEGLPDNPLGAHLKVINCPRDLQDV